MQQLAYTVDQTLENAFITCIGSRAGVGVVVADGVLTISLFDEIPAGTFDTETGEAVTSDLDPGQYSGGSGSTTTTYGAVNFATSMGIVVGTDVMAIDPGAEPA